MKTRGVLFALLLIVILVSGCDLAGVNPPASAPGTTSGQTAAQATQTPYVVFVPVTMTPGSDAALAQQQVAPTKAPKPAPTKAAIAVPTSCDEVTDESKPAPWFLLRNVANKVATNLVYFSPAKNTLGYFSKSWLGEPGVILFGKDTPKSTVDGTKGSGEYMTPDVNQFVIKDNSGRGVVPVASGRYLWVAFQEGIVDLGNKSFVLREKQDHMWIAVFRTTGANPQAVLRCVVPYHNQEMTFPKGWVVSEGFFKQNARDAYAPGENCDGRGCKELSILLFDEYNDAVSVATQKGADTPWVIDYTNWQ